MSSACILHKQRPRDRAMDFILNELMSLPTDRNWRVSWEEIKSERSLQQNKYLFHCYGEISKQHGYERADLHDDFLKRHFGSRLKRVPPCREYPDGLKEVPVRTTTRDEYGRRSVLGKIAFWELVEFVQRYSAENYDVVLPDPDPEYTANRQRRAA